MSGRTFTWAFRRGARWLLVITLLLLHSLTAVSTPAADHAAFRPGSPQEEAASAEASAPTRSEPDAEILAGSLNGHVTTLLNNPIPYATVAADGMASVTNADGYYTLVLAAGVYTVTASKAGYYTETLQNFVITDGLVITQDFALDFPSDVPDRGTSGEANDGSLIGAVSISQDARLGAYALRSPIAGEDDRMQVGGPGALTDLDMDGPYSVMVWVKVLDYQDTGIAGLVVLGSCCFPRDGYSLSLYTNGQGRFWGGSTPNNNNYNVFGLHTLWDDEWHHVGARVDGDSVELLLDGVLDGILYDSNIPTAPSLADPDQEDGRHCPQVGGDGVSGPNDDDVLIDEVRVYGYYLDDDAWAAAMNGAGPLPDRLYYDFEVRPAVYKTVEPDRVAPGGVLTYTLAFVNGSQVTATNVLITDVVPAGLTVQSVVSSGVAISDTGAVPPYAWQVQDLVPGQAGVITITAVVSPGLLPGSLVNTAVLTSSAGGNASAAPVTVYYPPPTIDIVSIITTAGYLVADIDLYDPQGDPLSGVVEIVSGPGQPATVIFETLSRHNGDAFGLPLQLLLNDTLLDQTYAPRSTSCTPGVGTLVITDAAVADSFSIPDDNTWTFEVPEENAYQPHTAWARATVAYSDGTTQTLCIFDYGGGDCTELDLCAAGFVSGTISASLVQSSPHTLVVAESYSDSVLPPFLDTSGVVSGTYLLHATTTDGVDSDQDLEPFDLTDEPLLLINPLRDLRISKSVVPVRAGLGQVLTYTLSYTNDGTLPVGGALITDLVPITLTQFSYAYAGPVITATPGITYAWQVADLAPGEEGVITITAQVDWGSSGVFSLTNQATITAAAFVAFDGDLANNTATVSHTVDAEVPEPPTLLSPPDGSLTRSITLDLAWAASPSPDVTGYWLDWNGGVVDVGDVTEYATGFLADGVYTWTVAAYDGAGNTSPYTDVWSVEVDATWPEILQTSPADGELWVALDRPIVISFSEAIVTGTFDYSLAPDPGGWAATWSDGDAVLTLDHDPFAEGTTYQATVSAAEDPAGNPLLDAPVEWAFVTAFESCTPVLSVDLGLITTGTIYVGGLVEFEADVGPDDFTPPYNYVIDYGDGTVTTDISNLDPLVLSHTYAASDTYTVELRVLNCGMTEPVTDSLQVPVGTCLPLEGVTILGETGGNPGDYTFTAEYTPTNASPPIDYLWDNGDATISTTRSLSVGVHSLTLTATNCLGVAVSDTHVIDVQPICTQVTGVDLSQVTTGPVYPDDPVTFEAALTPADASVPYTYTVRVDGQTVISPLGGSAKPLVFTYTFASTGTYTVEVGVWNCDVTAPVSDTLEVLVEPEEYTVYLPIVTRQD